MMEMTKPCGEFLIRTDKNFRRLEEEEYTPEYIRHNAESGYSWPGDWEGRIILALALHHKTKGKQPVYLRQIISDVYQRMQAVGYLGMNHRSDMLIDEQQLAGHSWLLRGLIACRSFLEDSRLDEMIRWLIEGLYLPTAGRYKEYPLGKCRVCDGKAMGSIQKEIMHGWQYQGKGVFRSGKQCLYPLYRRFFHRRDEMIRKKTKILF